MRRLLMAATLAASPALLQASPLEIYSEIYIFGDSLSDSGNVAILTEGAQPDPDFFPGTQFTDGDTWATQLGLAPSLAGGTNYAFGAARARDNGPLPPDAMAQVANYLRDGGTIDDSLAALWLGGNDLRDSLLTLDPTTLAALALGARQMDEVVATFFSNGAILDDALSAISASLDLLELTPLKGVAVIGLPNFARVPEVLGIAGTLGSLGETALNLATAVSQEFNARLQAEVASLSPGLSASYVDIFGLFEDIAADPGAFGFSDIQTPCLIALQAGVASDCSGYLFFDSIHPTEAAHALIAERFAETVAPVPLPASVGFLLAGLGGLVLLRKRSAMA